MSGAQMGNTTTAGGTATVTVSAEGTTAVTHYAVDFAGNAELPKTMTIKIDKTAPEAVNQFDTVTTEGVGLRTRCRFWSSLRTDNAGLRRIKLGRRR